ncbi:MAG: hypothetical protein IT342_01150 [Candidatus Melainabacteria bacterium]|nr:hypothetical protein [Candidatus Melainabacteria bacterium]
MTLRRESRERYRKAAAGRRRAAAGQSESASTANVENASQFVRVHINQDQGRSAALDFIEIVRPDGLIIRLPACVQTLLSVLNNVFSS